MQKFLTKGSLAIVIIFLMACASSPPLLDAVYYQDYDKVVALIEKGEQDINGKDNSGRTPLIIAAYYNYGPILEYLVEHGADLDAVDSAGKTALHHTAHYRSFENTKILLEKGPTPISRIRKATHPFWLQHMETMPISSNSC